MFGYLEGVIERKNPTYLYLDISGIGYHINISLQTFHHIKDREKAKLFIEEVIREDVFMLYGFYTESERDFFNMLISVSGIGSSTARLILSSLTLSELAQAIREENEAVFKKVKGVGTKTARRLIVDLKDKVPLDFEEQTNMTTKTDNSLMAEAFTALIALGFPRKTVAKVMKKLTESDEKYDSVEDLIKAALKNLS